MTTTIQLLDQTVREIMIRELDRIVRSGEACCVITKYSARKKSLTVNFTGILKKDDCVFLGDYSVHVYAENGGASLFFFIKDIDSLVLGKVCQIVLQ